MPLLSPPELDEKLRDIIARLRRAFSPSAIYLFGSYAYGTPGPDSDIDLIVIVEESPLTPHARDGLAYQAIGSAGVSKDVQVYTRRKFEERASLRVSFERTVKEKGKLVYAA